MIFFIGLCGLSGLVLIIRSLMLYTGFIILRRPIGGAGKRYEYTNKSIAYYSSYALLMIIIGIYAVLYSVNYFYSPSGIDISTFMGQYIFALLFFFILQAKERQMNLEYISEMVETTDNI